MSANMYGLTSALCIALASSSSCETGQGASSSLILGSDFKTEAGCAANCLARPSCKFYDYTTVRQISNSCRLFPSEAGSLTDPGDQNREICDVGMASQYSVTYDCMAGQGADRAMTYHQSASEIECANSCKNDANCKFFDYTSRRQQDNCRLYASDKSHLDPGSYSRVFCSLTTQEGLIGEAADPVITVASNLKAAANFKLKNPFSGKCVTINTAEGPSDGANIQLEDCTDNPSAVPWQVWTWKSDQCQYSSCALMNPQSGKCLDAKFLYGTLDIELWPCSSSEGMQLWGAHGDGFESPAGFCMSVNSTDGSNMQAKLCEDNSPWYQKFTQENMVAEPEDLPVQRDGGAVMV